MGRTYIAIDLKSFYASVECMERGLDPLTTNLVVADASRTEKTICLAVSPSLKAYGIPGRARLFEVVQRLYEVNCIRRGVAPGHALTGRSTDDRELKAHPELEVDYIAAPPRMAYYMKYSADIYQIYLKYAAPEDIHVYSIDEVFIDATAYLKLYRQDAYGFARMLVEDVLKTTGITATVGIGTNLYLCKVAMDIVAKRVAPDANGIRVASLDEDSYRRLLWDHRPLTDFWRVGPGIARKLERRGMFTMGDVARQSLGQGEDSLYRLFGVNAELLIDHAWGYEPCTIADIKAYTPSSSSISSGQVLTCPYPSPKARLVAREMADLLSLDLVEKGLVTGQLTLTIGYDVENITRSKIPYTGPVVTDHYGRTIPKHAHGTHNFQRKTASTRQITQAITELYDRIADPALLVRRLTISASVFSEEAEREKQESFRQLDLFSDPAETAREEAALEREKRRQQAVLDIKHKYGKNAILRGMNLEEGATARERNRQIGGHKA